MSYFYFLLVWASGFILFHMAEVLCFHFNYHMLIQKAYTQYLNINYQLFFCDNLTNIANLHYSPEPYNHGAFDP